MQAKRSGSVWRGFGSAGPRGFYAMGEDGLFLDFSTPATLFRDAAGATPLTAPSQTIGLACDKSRARSPVTVYAGVQASAGLRPTYGRAPKSRRNLWQGDSRVNTGWTAGGTTPPIVTNGASRYGIPCVAVEFTEAMTATYAGCRANSAAAAPTVAGRTYTGSVDVCLSRALTGGEQICIYSTGSASLPQLFLTAANSAALVGQFGRVKMPSGAPGLSGINGLYVFLNRPLATPVTAYIKDFQLEDGAVQTPYQSAATAFEVTEHGYPAYGFARLDGADDKLTIALPSAITGDLMIFGRNGSWIEAGVTLPSGAFDLGPTGTVLTPGVLRALGDLVGVVIIGRTTTATERALALRYFAARGAANWLVAGAEMLPNGGFADGTGWTNGSTGTGTAAISGGQATLTGVDVSNRGALSLTTSVTGITIGQPYMIQWQITSGTANSQVTVSSGGTVMDRFGASVAETRRAVFIAGATAIGFSVNVYGAGAVVFDNFSIKPLTVGA